MTNKTIAAIATPAGDGALGVIRISGENAVSVADKVFRAFSNKPLKDFEGYSAAYGEIIENGNRLDDAVALVFKAPHSYTGEDTVEFSVHGGSIMMRSILRLILKNGAAMAGAGEFTKRAFLNGKTDLTKAESIMGLISARNEAEMRLSRAAHGGKVAKKIAQIEADLISADAAISVFSDYPDEDIEDLSFNNFHRMLKNAALALEKMLNDYEMGKILTNGIITAIVGKPNVGKSTLMNMLSGTERSIVTEVAGTTRDIIEETVSIGDLTLKLADTAGIHNTDDTVESIGVNLAKEKIEASQLILAVFDLSREFDEEDTALLEQIKDKNTLIIINKTDLERKADISKLERFKSVEISAKCGNGYEELCKEIKSAVMKYDLSPDSAVLLGERQHDCAQRALDGVCEAINALESGCTLDAVGVCVDDALSALLELTGKRVTNEVADEIFRKFCVGK
ncbi:MAG: tRNA uridine-5-carboxymethylaminomethyl(34) synthesis GTPase MnmE [Ruminococcaceae bacterium]|nr:tRNA uridine-5-carboxymethylaminomethyl(34) synthesis GTPase MnmE [Oscillospiraceae bacterium]